MKKTILLFSLSVCTLLFVNCKKEEEKKEVTIEKKVETLQNPIAADAATSHADLTIDGMSCAIGCAKTIEDKLNHTEGVSKAKVDFDKKTASIDFDGNVQTPEKLIAVIEAEADGKTYKVSKLEVKMIVKKKI
ncbi:hypothetical protein B0A58_13845 [Flavobacterium branchiophilum NBRC 15030 = ATCC 35035]|uniref:Heavy-metal-associated domain-containing protein n=1 Tax=Flavobacterium branchiophilum TaxID=55197 RepID=A0A543G4Y3_9FLAO|nr:heavy metal-associated domain-containing protein [Flavobacterium branchiophilum]OXA71277.1 hypothetical protein B0A58_13845 [Flavobacterium branchiophilum NBRC 15030 = ATCC 35035]TQM41140.1 heavy-metal-associated domain-containing protein [Flavobacterium branchiophilum]GEM56546.1 hypothetical protein FB1_27670 [Flavobacterium branchiophilum NBRC 15030 = ATCC 35035]